MTEAQPGRDGSGGTRPEGAEVVDIGAFDALQRSDELAELLTRGRERGFVTTDELEELAAAVDAADGAGALLRRMVRRAGIAVIDVGTDGNRHDGRTEPSSAMTPDSVRLYLNEIGQVALLTADEEADLAKRIAAGSAAAAILDSPAELSPRDRTRLRLVERDGIRARARMVESNLRLVVSVAKRYLGRGLQMSDLVQEGNLGLIRAVEKFDPTRGYKFSTYATWWIRQMINRGIADTSRMIRVPVHLVETLNKIARVERQLVHRYGREPTMDEVAAEVDLPVERVEELRALDVDPTSLDTPIGEEADGVLGDIVEDGDAVMPVDAAARLLLQQHLAQILTELNERERRVIETRFGLHDGRQRTLEQVGDDLGLTRERIRQIEAKALAKLRHPSLADALRDYLQE